MNASITACIILADYTCYLCLIATNQEAITEGSVIQTEQGAQEKPEASKGNISVVCFSKCKSNPLLYLMDI